MHLSQNILKQIESINRNDVLDICAPLFKNTPITHFDYSRYYKDFSYLALSGNETYDMVYISSEIPATFDEIDYYEQPFAYYSPVIPSPLNSPKFISRVQIGCDFDIPNRLGISHRTVDTHLHNIKVKLDRHFETNLIEIAKENNL